PARRRRGLGEQQRIEHVRDDDHGEQRADDERQHQSSSRRTAASSFDISSALPSGGTGTPSTGTSARLPPRCMPRNTTRTAVAPAASAPNGTRYPAQLNPSFFGAISA